MLSTRHKYTSVIYIGVIWDFPRTFEGLEIYMLLDENEGGHIDYHKLESSCVDNEVI